MATKDWGGEGQRKEAERGARASWRSSTTFSLEEVRPGGDALSRGTVTFLPDKLQNETIQKMLINALYHHFGVRLSPSNLIAAPRGLP